MTHESSGTIRGGVTLAELLVVIVILALIASVAVHAFASPPREGRNGRMLRSLMAARAQAIKKRRPVVVRVQDSSGAGVATALPDGSIIGDARVRASLHLSTLTGAVGASRDSSAGRD